MEKSTLVPMGIIGIVIVLIIVISVTGIPLTNNASETTCSLYGGPESILFRSDVYGTEDSLTFHYTPKDEKPATYYTSYEIYEYGSPIISEYNKVYDQITPANPIAINVSRKHNATYTMNMSIWKTDESCPIFLSRVTIAVGQVK